MAALLLQDVGGHCVYGGGCRCDGGQVGRLNATPQCGDGCGSKQETLCHQGMHTQLRCMEFR